MPAHKTGVFISYARSDGEILAAELHQRLSGEGIPLWRDLASLEGGRDWWLQITGALDQVAFMVLLMTPAAITSTTVRKEWRYARQRGVCVYPVKASPEIDFEVLPRWMKTVHFYDLDKEWRKFVNDLNVRRELPRVPFMADDLPAEFVERPLEYNQLISKLLDRTRDEPIAITAAIRAAGGFGKTVLARALCHDEDVQNAFDDGILWVTLGETPGDLTRRVEDLIFILSGQRPGFAGVEAATAFFVDLLADRDILLILDDAWDAAHLQPFIQGGPRCARVITTRVLDALPPGTTRVDVDAMRRGEAITLLGFGLPDGFDHELSELAERLGEWPLLLKLVNAAIRDRVHDSQQSIPDSIAFVNKALTRRGMTFFDARDATARNQAVANTLNLSIERLRAEERSRLEEMAVFPEDVDLPLATLERFWARTGALDELDTESLCERLARLSLVLAFDAAKRRVRLHDVIRRFLIHRVGNRLSALQREFLASHRPPTGAWADLPASEPYLWDHLAEHLIEAADAVELINTLQDGRFLVAKTAARNALAVESDLKVAEREAPSQTLTALRRSFVQASHLLNRCESVDDVRATLLSRIEHVPGLEPVVASLAGSMTYWRATSPLPDLPHPALIRTFRGGGATLWGCAVSPDGASIATAGYDGRIHIWNTDTGAERQRLTGHSGWVRRCRFSPDGALLVSASFDRRVRIWDVATGAVLHELAAHTDGVTDCVFTPDSLHVVSTSLDNSIVMWNARTGAIVRRLSAEWRDERGGWLVRGAAAGHIAAVWACSVSRDGRWLLSASGDQTLKLWDLETGSDIHTFEGHTAAVQACAFSPDGRTIASAGGDVTVRVWDASSGTERLSFQSRGGAVSACAFTPDGSGVAVACYNGTVHLHEAVSGLPLAVYFGHTDIATDCAFSPDGSFLVSVSMDATLKQWDVGHARSTTRRRSHLRWVNACAIARDDDTVVSAASDMTLKLWSARTGQPHRTLVGHSNSVRGCAITPHGRRIVSASADNSVRVWPVAPGRSVVELTGHRDWVNACDVTGDGTLAVSGSSDKTFRVWDLSTYTRRLTVTAHRDSLNACRFSPDMQFIGTASSDGHARLWSLARLRDTWEAPPAMEWRPTFEECERRLQPISCVGHGDGINDCAFSPDGQWLATASSDRTIRIWSTSTGQMVRTIFAHRHDVTSCTFSRDGTLVASVSIEGEIKAWEAATGRCLATLLVDGALFQCLWFADSRRLVAVGSGGVYFLALAR